MWQMHFSPVRLEILGFVVLLLKTFCTLHICCGLVGKYPAYIAAVLSYHCIERLRVSQLGIPTTDSPIHDIYRKYPKFEIGPFRFSITTEEDYASFSDYSVYEITRDSSFL